MGSSLFCSLLMYFGGRILHSIIVAVLITFFIDIQFELIEGAGLWAKYAWLCTALGVFAISWMLKENFFLITTTIFSVFFVVTLGQWFLSRPADDPHFKKPNPGTVGQYLPRIIHLVLDAHIGIEGIPQDTALGQEMKADLESFYQKNGFTVFGGAYSHFPMTLRSISNYLNFSANPDAATPQGDPYYDDDGSEPHSLLQNRYFELLSRQGYIINVWANALLIDYCSESAVVIENCEVHPPLRMDLLQDSDLFLVKKLRVVFSHFLNLGYTVPGIGFAYGHFREALSEKGFDLPPWNWSPPRPLMVLSSLKALDTLSEKIGTLPPGNVLFSHLIIPHAPFVTRSDCSLNPLLEQWEIEGGKYSLEQKNTSFSREERYLLYFQQMKCIYRKLDILFEQMRKHGIFDDSIIIIHGDHGSRIGRYDMRAKYLKHLSTRDLEDYFSTLFAVKHSNGKKNYSTIKQPIEDLLAKTVFPNIEITNKPKESKPFFYFRGKEGRQPRNFFW